MQKSKQASFRPCRSANCPTKYPEIPAERKPVVKRSATVDSGSPTWSL